ncbi:YodC family protein [Plesiomonas shigelloides]|uniref:YodC family protein n=1 Tax=Plesiomonas shigelloides TaxID=703 RepID=UPI0031B7691B
MSFKSGDIVKLKSGGPEMTVQSVTTVVVCQWFAGKKLELGRFNPNSLEPVNKENE